MYEVLKFIEHGLRCRQSMDCVQGTILLSYLKKKSPDRQNSAYRLVSGTGCQC